MAPETPNYDTLPKHKIYMDWQAYECLTGPELKLSFVKSIASLVRSEWLHFDKPQKPEWAAIDLDEYDDFDQFDRALKKAGSSFYESRKAEKRGYYSKFFDYGTFVGDIVDIDGSSAERQGKPMTPEYLYTVEQRGGHAKEVIRQVTPPPQNVFWVRRFGTFRPNPGHRRGPLVLDEQLVSYLSVQRFGDFSFYSKIIGHADYLRDGIMHKMHGDFVKSVLDNRNAQRAGSKDIDSSLLGLRYIAYAAYFYASPGLKLWKKSNLFNPRLFGFDYVPALKLSDSPENQFLYDHASGEAG